MTEVMTILVVKSFRTEELQLEKWVGTYVLDLPNIVFSS